MANEDEYILNLHQEAKPSTFENAKFLRRAETKAEKILWKLLRNRQLNRKKFRRQHPIAQFVLDFYCHECKLDVELDGYFHLDKENQEYDRWRTSCLNDLGIRVIRFFNNEVIQNPEAVLRIISKYLYP